MAEYDSTRKSAHSQSYAPSMHSANAQVNFDSLHFRKEDQPTAIEQVLIDYLMFGQ